MHRLMPDFILDQYAAGQTSGELSAAALFVDVSGFSSMTDRLMLQGQEGAEVLATVMRAAFEPLIQSVVEQGGFIAVQAGDAFTAIFPLGDEPEGGASRSLAAAWNIQLRAAEQPLHHTRYGDFPVSVKVGGSVGTLSWGILESMSGEQAAYYFRGSVIDDSAEAERRAGAGQIILDKRFCDRVKEQVNVEAQEGFFLVAGLKCELPPPQAFAAADQDTYLLQRFFPGELYAQRHLGEFRQVVYLFVSAEHADDESGLQRFMQHIFDLQGKYGGLLSVHFGDKGAHVLLLWGAPTAYENDIQRALNFVLDLRELVGGDLRAGLAYRIAHAGFIGSDLAEQYAAYGRGPNLAARFMEAAPPGAIWVDDYVAQRAGQSFELEYVGKQSFKGFATPMKVHLLRWRKERSQTFFAGKLIGRTVELERLAGLVRPILEGRYVGLVLVRGEPGMGKSRLVYEFLQRLHEDRPGRVQDFLGQTDEIVREGLNPFTYWLRHYFEFSSAQPEEANKARFTARLDALIGTTTTPLLAAELDRTRSVLGALLGLHWPDSLYEGLDAQERHENSLIALTTLLQAESLRKPVVFVLEDMQWLDATSAEYLARLTRALTADERVRYPLIILGTIRTGEASPWLAGLASAQIDLGLLDRPGLAALADARLSGPASDSLAELLQSRSEGNPFFAEQILRYLQEQNLLTKGETGWSLESSSVSSLLPLEVSAVLVARLDRLASEVREAVQTAAVLGREFEVQLLSHMLRSAGSRYFTLSPERAFRAAVTTAETETIWAKLDELRYIFRHALLRDTAYQMQLEARRQELHGAAVSALEAVYHNELPPHYAELAYHADRAGSLDKARDYYQLAGDAAAGAYRNAQAAEYYTRALVLTPGDDHLARYSLLLEREQIYGIAGERDKWLADLDELETLARGFDDNAKLAHVLLRRARYAWEGGDYPPTIRLAQRSIDLATPLGAWETASAAYAMLAVALYRFGQPERAREEAERGLDLAIRFGSPLDQSLLQNHLGLIYFEQRESERARASFERSFELARQANDLHAQSRALGNMGMVASALGDYPAARRTFEESLAIWRRIGLRASEAADLANLGLVAGNMGEYEKARNYLETQLRISREMGDVYSETYGCINLSAQLGALGDKAAAQEQAEHALLLANRMGDLSGQAWALTYLGHSQFALGELDRAATSYRQALEIRRMLSQPVLATEPLAGLARTSLAKGDLATAQKQTDEILSYLESSGSFNGTDDPLRVYFACYLVLAAADDSRGRPLLAAAHIQLMERADKIEDAETRQGFLTNVEINHQIERAWQDGA